MKKIKFLIKAIKRMDYKSFFKITKKVSKKSNKPYIITLFDIIYCGLKYQAGYMDYMEFEFYKLNNKQRKTYLTRGKNNAIVNKYNDKNYWHYLSNKLEFNEKFKKYLKRDYINLNTSSLKDFELFLKNKDFIIAKEVDNCGGVGINKIKVKDYKIEDLYKELKKKKQYLVEEVIKQNSKINKLYDGSINILVNQPWNQSKTDDFNSKYIRVNSWEDIEKVLNQIFHTKNYIRL